MTFTSSNVRVIGLAGASNGGKTTICKKIKSMDNWQETYTIIHLDDYYWPRDNPIHKRTENGTMINFDCIEAIDWDRLILDVHKELSCLKPTIECMIIEGIFACTYPKICEILHSKVFLELDYETMKTRRSQREYIIPDEEGYFDSYVYPCYLDTLETLRSQPKDIPVYFINGSDTKQKVFDRVLQIFHSELKSISNISEQMREVKVESS